jgi:PTS system mannose-specific IIA component
MIGILVVTHGDLGQQIIKSAQLIGLDSEESVSAVSIDPTTESYDVLREKVSKSIAASDSGDGVLILTDLFGGTPTNISLSFLEDGQVEVVTGVNLPMMVRAINSRVDHDLVSLSKVVSDSGRESIYLAGEVLRQRLADKESTTEKS